MLLLVILLSDVISTSRHGQGPHLSTAIIRARRENREGAGLQSGARHLIMGWPMDRCTNRKLTRQSNSHLEGRGKLNKLDGLEIHQLLDRPVYKCI